MYSIGEFSKIVGIPISTLRFYDEKEVLVPQKRNLSSSYRYYAESQIFDAIAVLQLKVWGMSLPDIKYVMHRRGFESMQKCMADRIEDCQKEINRLEACYQSTAQLYQQLGLGLEILEKFQAGKEISKEEIFTVSYLPETNIVGRQVQTNNFLNDRILKTAAILFDICEAEKLRLNGPLTMLFLNDSPERFVTGKYTTLMFYPIQASVSKHPAISKFGGFWALSAIHIGSYETLTPLYGQLTEQAEKRGLTITGDPFEEYLLNTSFMKEEENYITRISFPIKEPV